MYEYDDRLASRPRFLSNVPGENRDFIRQAAEETGFDIVIHDGTVGGRGCISVWTNEPRRRDHGPFWQAYRHLMNPWRLPHVSP